MTEIVDKLRSQYQILNCTIGLELRNSLKEKDYAKEDEILNLTAQMMNASFNMLFAYFTSVHKLSASDARDAVADILNDVESGSLVVRDYKLSKSA